MMKACVLVTCCVLLEEGRGLETIGPKMSSSSAIGAASTKPLPSLSGASVCVCVWARERDIKTTFNLLF